MRNKFLSFFFIVFALFAWVMPVKADVNWSTLGAEIEANGEYYIYNVGQSRFLAQKELTDDLSQALCFTIIESTTDRSALGVGKLKALKYGEKKYANRPTSTWPATSASTVFAIKPLGDTYHHHNISGVQNMGSPSTGDDFQLKNFWYGSSTTMIAQATDLPGSNTENYEWVFIPKATFDNYKWYAMAATVEVGQEYYIYNPSVKRLVGFQGALTDQIKDALVFTPSQNANGLYAYKSDKLKTGTSYYYFKHATAPPTWGTSADYGALYQDNGVYYMAKRQNLMTEPVTYAYKYMYASDASTMTMKSTTQSDWSAVDASCQWLFIPKASMDVLVPLADREEDIVNDWTDNCVTAPTSSGFYYLYNPASGCFLGKNGTSANPGVSTDPEQATMFWVSYTSSGKKYSFCYTDQAAFKYIKNATDAATSTGSTTTSFVLEETSSKRYHMQCNGTYLYINNGGTNPTFAVGTTPNEYSRWVFIPRASYVTLTTPATPPTDKWLAKAVAPEDKGLYYIYNPVSKRFLGKASLQDAETGYPKQFQVNANAGGKFSLAYDEGNGTEVNFVANLKTNWGESEAFFTVAEKSTKSHYYTIATILTSSPYNNRYISVQKTGATAYALNLRYNDISKYKYTNTANVINEDVWNEWLFIPAADFEAEFASAPTAEDIWTAHGAAPEIGKKYFLYNVEAQKFFKWEHLTANTEEALLCTVGEEESGKYISFLANSQTKYVSARAGYGYENSSYILDWEETATDSKQYYIFHNALNEMYGVTIYDFNIHLSANKTYEGYSASAIKNGCRPSDLSGKHKWVFVEPVATLYYSASASIHEGQGDVYVYFDTPSMSASTGVLSTGSLSASLVKTATFMAMPETGYQFLGWKADPDGDFISTDAMYEHALTVTSTDSEHPDDVTLYAFFENKDAEVFDQDGISKGEYETLTAALAAASKGYTIKLKRNLSGQQTINKGVVIDFNGFTISGTDDNLVIVSAPSTDTVTFLDNTVAAQGGVALAYGEATGNTSKTAVKVTAGTLVIRNGNYSAAQSYSSYVGTGQAYVVNRTGGNVRVNGGYFMATKYGVMNQQTDYVHIFNGNNIQLYGGYYTSNVENNLSNRVGTDMEVVSVLGIAPYVFTVKSALDESTVVATANDKKFSSLADAIAYANNNAETTVTIRLAKDCSLPAGNYVIPAKATLLVPYSSLHTEPTISCPLLNNSKLPSAAYRTLTLESGVHIDVYGAIEVGGCAYSYGNGATGTGRPNSDYGHMIMNEGSEIVLNNHSNLRAWGFVTGAGTIDVRRGARVDEMFQVYDFKGGRGTLAMYENGGHKAFPMNQYFIQNVEVKATFRPGSALYTTMAAVNTGISVKIIGVDTDGAALFKMDETDDSEDTWVRKWYNPATDQQVYDINNSAAISNLFLPLSAVTGVEGSDFDSKDYILPITNNFKIHVLSGQMDITQDVAFLPGAELEIDKLCTGHINENTTTYFYDSEEWGTYVYNGAYASKIKYRPGGLQYNRDISSAAGLGDAKMNVHGTLEVDGGFRTTEHGANIFSTNADAGTITYTDNSLTTYTDEILDTWTHQVYHPASADNDYKASADAYYIALPAYPAKLQNASGFTSTTTAAVGDNAGKSFCYINDEWRLMTDVDCSIVTDGVNYYIKPQGYVQLSSGSEDGEHLYHDISGTHDYILAIDQNGNCQCWEVEDVVGHPELKHSIHPQNDVYYYYDDAWVEKKFTIKWINWDGTPIEQYEMRMGAKLQYLGSTPAREASSYYTYDFAGWYPAIAADAIVTDDAIYTAQFNQTDRKYIITFKNTNAMLGDLFEETQYLRMGEMPTPPALDPMLASILTWTPAVGAVTGDQVYNLSMNMFASSYSIRFVNWDGEELQSGSVDAGDTPEYTNATPVKPAIGDESYSFVGWTPEVVAATADAVYTAKFTAEHTTGLSITDEQTISDTRVVIDLRITTTGSLTVTGKVIADNLILEATSDVSGQLDAASEDKLDITNAFFDWKPNGETGTASRTWYAIAVPWEVNAETGIFLKETGRHLVIGQDFDLIYYDGETRASQGNKPACWKYVQHDPDKTMHPGQMYMMYFDPGFVTIRFAKKSGSAVLYTTPINVSLFPESTDNMDKDANWNGIANPRTYYASLSAGSANYAQVLNNGSLDDYFANPGAPVYQTINLASSKFTVGKPLFVQATEATSVVVTKQTTAGIVNAAPRRARVANLPKGIDAVYRLAIAGESEPEADNLFVQVAEDEKADRYTIGQDLVKGGVASGRAQVWVNRYDAKLSVNTQALSEDEATYPLTIQVPANGDYVLSVGANDNEDYALYLTRDGEAIWNLSNGAYVGSFEKGTTSEYGLRVSAKAPQIATGIDEAVVDAKGGTRKVLINNTVYIIRGENVYSMDGQLVK